jgi:hypothetical protein
VITADIGFGAEPDESQSNRPPASRVTQRLGAEAPTLALRVDTTPPPLDVPHGRRRHASFHRRASARARTALTLAWDEKEASCSPKTALLLCVKANVSLLSLNVLGSTQDPFRRVMESLLTKGSYLQDLLRSGTDSDRPPLPIRMTPQRVRMWSIYRDFRAQRRTRTGGPFLTMVDLPNFGKSETA